MKENKNGEEETEDRADRAITFTPLGDNEQITLTIGTVRQFLAAKTKSGKTPTDEDIVKFMMLCQARQLNPWVGDAYLLGYDGRDGPEFSLITAKQALDKRAEINSDYNGIESGIIVEVGGAPTQREGALYFGKEKLIGAWAKAYRKNRDKPFYHDVKFDVYDTGRSRWKKDPGGMIVKVAEAGALRKAFPTQIGGLYLAEEHDSRERNITPSKEEVDVASKALLAPQPKAIETTTEESRPKSQSSLTVENAKQQPEFGEEQKWDGDPIPELEDKIAQIEMLVKDTEGMTHKALYAELRERKIINEGDNLSALTLPKAEEILMVWDKLSESILQPAGN